MPGSLPSSRLRACDRCAQLKAQCTAGECPCGRCRRLGLDCTHDRPMLIRGRPRKHRIRGSKVLAQQQQSSQSFHSPTSSAPAGETEEAEQAEQASEEPTIPDYGYDGGYHTEAIEDWNQLVPVTSPSRSDQGWRGYLAQLDLPIEAHAAEKLLEQVLDIADSVGILSGFRRSHYRLIARCDSDAGSSIEASERRHEMELFSSRAILCTLLTCAESFARRKTGDPAQGQEALENYRIYALSDIPIFIWKSRPVSSGDTYCLNLLSSLGYMQKDLTDMASRWALLSETLIDMSFQSSNGRSAPSPAPFSSPPAASVDTHTEMDRRITALVSLNSDVHRVLVNRPSPYDHTIGLSPLQVISDITETDLDALGNRHPQTSDTDWHGLYSQEKGGDASLDLTEHGFFDLYLPLQRCLKQALMRLHKVSFSESPVARTLEDYFVTFPTSLMRFADVRLPWQLEAMIWFHGIYLLITCGPDILTAATAACRDESSALVHAAEHALLLGEALPYLLDMDSAILRVSHLTIYFITLSAAVHVYLLQHVFNGHYNPAPPLLLESAKVHFRILESIVRDSKTCDHVCVVTVTRILGLIVTNRSFDAYVKPEQLAPSLDSLRPYRWIPGGQGLLPIDGSTIKEGSDFDNVAQISNPVSSADLQHVFNPSARINEPGTFDLSILF